MSLTDHSPSPAHAAQSVPCCVLFGEEVEGEECEFDGDWSRALPHASTREVEEGSEN